MLKKLKTRINRSLLVVNHARAMWRQLTLPKNEQKGDWCGEDVRDLLELAKQEYEELFVACWELEHGKGSAERVAEEAADLSNFAAMVADKARRKQRGGDHDQALCIVHGEEDGMRGLLPADRAGSAPHHRRSDSSNVW